MILIMGTPEKGTPNFGKPPHRSEAYEQGPSEAQRLWLASWKNLWLAQRFRVEGLGLGYTGLCRRGSCRLGLRVQGSYPPTPENQVARKRK